MRIRWTHWGVLLSVSTLAACARDKPTAPIDDTARYSITGHLRLSGSIVDTNGVYQGTRVLGDADGVEVELLNGGQVVDRTTTVDGVYRFSGLRPGGYVARSWVVGDIGDETRSLVIQVADVVAADTIRLASRGDFRPVPNPLVDTTQVFFLVSDTMHVDIRIRDVAGNPVKTLLSLEVLPAEHAIFWNGRNTQGHLMPPGLYWITFAADLDWRAQLLFKEAPVGSSSASSSLASRDAAPASPPAPRIRRSLR